MTEGDRAVVRVALLDEDVTVEAAHLVNRDHTIPLSFIRVAAIYIGQQAYQGLFTADNISQMAHIVGGMIGSVLGFVINKYKMSRYERGSHG